MYHISYPSEVSVSLSYWSWSYPQLSSCTVVPETGPRSGADPRDLQKHIVHPDTVVRRRLKTHFYKSGYCCQAWTSMSNPIWPLHMTPPVLDKNSNRELDRFAIPLDPIPVPDPDDPRYPLGYRFTSLFPATRSFDPRFTSYSFI